MVRTVRMQQGSKFILRHLPQLETAVVTPTVQSVENDEGEQLPPETPLRITNVRLSSKRLWKGLQQVPSHSWVQIYSSEEN